MNIPGASESSAVAAAGAALPVEYVHEHHGWPMTFMAVNKLAAGANLDSCSFIAER